MPVARQLLVTALALVAAPAGAQPTPRAGLPVDAVARLGQTRLRHADRATCAAFAPDGKTLLTGGDDGAIRVWSVATGEQVGTLQKPGAGVEFLRLTHGGAKLVTQFGGAGAVRFLDPATLRETDALSLDNRYKLDFSADGKYMVASDAAGTATVTELATGLPKLELSGANRLAFRPDGKAVATADADTVTVHLLTGGKPIFARKLDGTPTGLAYSPDGARLAVGTRTPAGVHAIRIFDNGGATPAAEIAGMSLPRQWLSADRLACGNGDEAGVYDLAAKKWRGRVNAVPGEFAVSPDGATLAATGTGLRVRLYDLATGKQLHAENDSYPDPALLLGAPDGRSLFLLSADAAYHYRLGAAGARAVGAVPGRAVAAAFGGGTLAVATPDSVIVYTGFDPFGPFPKSPTHAPKDTAGAKAVAVSPDGKRVAWALEGGKVVAGGAGGGARRELPVTTTGILALGFNPTGDRLAVLGREPFLRVWDVTGDEAREVWKARVQRGTRGAIAFSPDGKLMTAASTGQLLVFDAADGTDDVRAPLFQCERYADNGPVHQAVFSPDSKLLVVGAGGMYGRVEVWELATRGLARTFATGYGGTSRVCLFPDGRTAASAGAEEAVTVWDVTFRAGKAAPKPSELLAAVADLSDPKADVGVPAVRLLASAGDTGTAQLALALKDSQANDKKLKEYVADLGSETFRIREIASGELVAQGVRALPAVLAATRSDDPEIRSRAREVMGRLNAKGFYPPDNGLIADKMRLFRAVQALELIGTPAARRVLSDIAATDGRPADEAKAALKRLK